MKLKSMTFKGKLGINRTFTWWWKIDFQIPKFLNKLQKDYWTKLQNRYFDLYWMNQRPQKPVLKLHNSRLLSVIAIGPTIKFYWVKTKSANVFTKIKSGEEIHDSHQLFKDFPNDLRQISISSFEVIYLRIWLGNSWKGDFFWLFFRVLCKHLTACIHATDDCPLSS